ncbi:hypothetical protein BH09DEP1_BH09DEP1_4400 [soil metagenome]
MNKIAILSITFLLGTGFGKTNAIPHPTVQIKHKAEHAAVASAFFALSALAGYMTVCTRLDALTPITAFYCILGGILGVASAKGAFTDCSCSNGSNFNYNVEIGKIPMQHYQH